VLGVTTSVRQNDGIQICILLCTQHIQGEWFQFGVERCFYCQVLTARAKRFSLAVCSWPRHHQHREEQHSSQGRGAVSGCYVCTSPAACKSPESRPIWVSPTLRILVSCGAIPPCRLRQGTSLRNHRPGNNYSREAITPVRRICSLPLPGLKQARECAQ
jgi:hypothetical protein